MPVRTKGTAKPKPKVPQQITAWSYSRYSDYEQCPKKAYYKYIERLPILPNDAMGRGTYIHELAELFVRDELYLHTDFEHVKKLKKKEREKFVPDELAAFSDEFIMLRQLWRDKKDVQVEAEWAFTQSWDPCGWFERPGQPKPWVRVKLDCAYVDGDTFVVIDFKTGKVRDTHKEQLQLYTIGAFLMAPEGVETVDAQLWYLDSNQIDDGNVYTRKDAENFKKLWAQKTQKMLADKRFKEKPSKLCGWCDFSKDKGGPCAY